jgi:hypothetical protein
MPGLQTVDARVGKSPSPDATPVTGVPGERVPAKGG